MRILLVSDTHLENFLFEKITQHYRDMDFYIHCGDSSLETNDPLLKKYYTVKGNHDLADFPQDIVIQVGNFRCLITHGNAYQVYYGNDILYQYMLKNDIDICFHGHTHVPVLTKIEDKFIINPGSVMINRGSYGFGTYAIITLENDIKVNYYNSQTFEECSELVLADGKLVLEEFKNILKKK